MRKTIVKNFANYYVSIEKAKGESFFPFTIKCTGSADGDLICYADTEAEAVEYFNLMVQLTEEGQTPESLNSRL
jgi:hypothetical protein